MGIRRKTSWFRAPGAFAAVLALFLWAAGGATAQLPLPDLPVRPPPVPPAGDLLRDTVDRADRTVDQTLRETRRVRVRDLLRRHRDVLERGPDDTVIIRREVLAFDPSPQALAQAQTAGFEAIRRRALAGLGAEIVVLRAPPRVSTRQALRRLEALDPGGVYDFNHVYLGADAGLAAPAATSLAAFQTGAATGTRIGLIDSGVAADHPAFASARITARAFNEAGYVPGAHGTAVASIIAGCGAGFSCAAPGAQLFSADIYGGAPTGGAADAIAAALSWMVENRVPVVNISLVGPPNATLGAVVRLTAARGHLLVAAVGNDGPHARPLYPAAWPEVVAVTGVDARRRAIAEAGRGDHVDFAAPGADIAAASYEGGFVPVRGTSFAAPMVAGLLARRAANPDPPTTRAAVAALAREAEDLGAAGRDRIYGDGLVGFNLRNDPSQFRVAGR
ncbi:MAG: S8 family serine peptidase [Maricaulaceae bacterium]|nr:S8 family serine peptidase [Maricaulaceae bacterium]